MEPVGYQFHIIQPTGPYLNAQHSETVHVSQKTQYLRLLLNSVDTHLGLTQVCLAIKVRRDSQVSPTKRVKSPFPKQP